MGLPVGLPVAIRLGWGTTLLAAPAAVLALVSDQPATTSARVVVRVLGVRNVLQAAALLRWPSPAAANTAAAVDAVHALTAVALAAGSSRWRTASLDALAAVAFAAATAAAARAGGG